VRARPRDAWVVVLADGVRSWSVASEARIRVEFAAPLRVLVHNSFSHGGQIPCAAEGMAT
jgi:hypothetical protein